MIDVCGYLYSAHSNERVYKLNMIQNLIKQQNKGYVQKEHKQNQIQKVKKKRSIPSKLLVT